MNLLINITWTCIVASALTQYIIGQDTTDDKSPENLLSLQSECFGVIRYQEKILKFIEGQDTTDNKLSENLLSLQRDCSAILRNQEKILKFIEENDFRCPHGFTPYKEKRSCYMVSGVTKSWSDARAHCQVYGGDLVSIESKIEHWFLKDRILSPHFNGLELWTSGTDSGVEGIFKWAATNRYFSHTYSRWLPNEPNNVVGGEDCVSVRGPVLDFNDRPCRNTYRFICEINP